MSDRAGADGVRAAIRRVATGVPGLDDVVGGGIPEYALTLIAGGPGSGKTTLAHQILFANATPERPGLYVTVLGEPPVKMLRYQRELAFFDAAKVGTAVHFVNVTEDVLAGEFETVLKAIIEHVERLAPGFVVIDSFRSLARTLAGDTSAAQVSVQGFAQQLAMYLTSFQTTSFVIAEYAEPEMQDNPIFTVADGALWLTQAVDRNSSVRKLQVLKMRGNAVMSGLHVVRMSRDGLRVFPRVLAPRTEVARRSTERLSFGLPRLDELLGGGVPRGDSVLVAGSAGTGKTVFAAHFLRAGLEVGEPAILTLFEERPKDFLERAKGWGFDFQPAIDQGRMEILYLRPLDLSVDETLYAIKAAVERLGARRIVIDSLTGFEIALAPTFREDFRESLYRLFIALTDLRVTVVATLEISGAFTEFQLNPHPVSFLTDDIIVQRYVEIGGRLRRVAAVVKMRASGHSDTLREYRVTEQGLEMGEPLEGWHGVVTGVPEPLPPAP
jgi:circadian clock protein KaiC